MAVTFYKIATVTVGSGGVSTIDFTSIPSTYTDLKLVISGRTTNDSGWRDYFMLRYNASSSSIYSRIYTVGYDASTYVSGSASAQSYHTAGVMSANDSTANTFGNCEVYIANYTSSVNKVISMDFIAENNNATAYMLGANAGLWASTAAINQITLYPYNVTPTGNFAQYTTATLYGISKS